MTVAVVSYQDQKLVDDKNINRTGSIYIPTQLLPSSKSEYPFIQKQL